MRVSACWTNWRKHGLHRRSSGWLVAKEGRAAMMGIFVVMICQTYLGTNPALSPGIPFCYPVDRQLRAYVYATPEECRRNLPAPPPDDREYKNSVVCSKTMVPAWEPVEPE